ncbi:MAG: hypothetical protein J6N51_01570 [Selenomonas sp.]|nr:hypothetical protein [Selenomonas sp.]
MDNENKIFNLEIIGQNGSFKVSGLTMNGSNYVSETKVDSENWPKVFQLTAKDEDGNITEQFDHAKLLQQERYAWDNNKFYLAFAPVSEQELKNADFQAQLEYLAMMADVDIDA